MDRLIMDIIKLVVSTIVFIVADVIKMLPVVLHGVGPMLSTVYRGAAKIFSKAFQWKKGHNSQVVVGVPAPNNPTGCISTPIKHDRPQKITMNQKNIMAAGSEVQRKEGEFTKKNIAASADIATTKPTALYKDESLGSTMDNICEDQLFAAKRSWDKGNRSDDNLWANWKYKQAEKIQNPNCGTFEYWDSLPSPNTTLSLIERKVIWAVNVLWVANLKTSHNVNGYVRRDGTHVRSHFRR